MPTPRILIALVALVAIVLTAALVLGPRTKPASAGIPTLLGDVSCDGSVTIADAQLIAQLIVGRISAVDCPENGDVNEDGGVTIADAQLIAQLIVGRISSLPPPPTAPPPPALASVVIADDGQFLGVFTCNRFAADSIFNRFGSYGSRFSSTSIWNRFGIYGGPFGAYSPFNPFATPPIITDGAVEVYLTMDAPFVPRVTPVDLVLFCFEDDQSQLEYWLGLIEDSS